MKTGIIFYSFEGNTKCIAKTIADVTQGDLIELKLKQEKTPPDFRKFIWGGRDVLLNKRPPIHPIQENFNNYDLLFIGTPVWAWSFAPPLNTFFSTYSLTGKNIALFCCHGGGKGNIFKKLKKQLHANVILGEKDFRDPLKRETTSNIESCKQWTQEILKQKSKTAFIV